MCVCSRTASNELPPLTGVSYVSWTQVPSIRRSSRERCAGPCGAEGQSRQVVHGHVSCEVMFEWFANAL